jgi:capsule polysaccharide export protein KpsE/RkpR
LSWLEIDKYLDKSVAFFSKIKHEKKSGQNEEKISVENNETQHDKNKFINITIDMESQFYQINILKLLNKWKFHLGVIILLAAILAAVFSSPFFITPMYKSYAIVYPSNISPYSDESETEQMLQIMQSSDIRDSLIHEFDLPHHYEIDTSYKYYLSTIFWEFSQNVKVEKTPYEGINIEVMDKDPKVACAMVNSMLAFYNKKVRSLHENKFGEVVKMFDRALIKEQEYVDSLKNRFMDLSVNYGLLDYSNQSREIARGYLKTIDGSGSSHINSKEVLRLKENIEKMGGEFILLRGLIENEAGKYSDLKKEYDRAYRDYDRKFTYTNVITEPYVADKKAYPVRWLIVIISSIAAFFAAFIAVLIFENYHGLAKVHSES